MRRLLMLLAALSALALLGPASPAEGGAQETATVEIVKVVDGDGPTGGYVIEYFCDEEDIDDSPPEGGGGGFGGSLNFDAAGPGSPETQTVVLTSEAICTVTETDSNGADTVTYSCSFVPGPGPGSPPADFAAEGGFVEGSCLDDQTAQITAPDDVATITVTNTFVADALPDDVEPDVVAATPAFTG